MLTVSGEINVLSTDYIQKCIKRNICQYRNFVEHELIIMFLQYNDFSNIRWSGYEFNYLSPDLIIK